MSDDSASESGSEYLPNTSDEDSDSGDSYLDDDSDNELMEDNEPIVEEGWQFLPDPFSDVRLDPTPEFNEEDAGISVCVPYFTHPCDAFCFCFL